MDFVMPRRIPEANIQAEIYRRLKELGVQSILEYRFKSLHLRADLIIIKENKIICACEVKSRVSKRPMTYGKQFQKYLKLGVPIFYCLNLNEIDKTIQRIFVLYNNL